MWGAQPQLIIYNTTLTSWAQETPQRMVRKIIRARRPDQNIDAR